MAVFVTFLGVRPSVALNATLVRSSSNFHKSCFVMLMNFCESMGKRRQPEGYFFCDSPRPPEIAFLPVNFQLFLSAAHRIRRVCVYKLDGTSKASYETSARREIRFSFRIYEMRSKKKWRNCMFWKRPKPAMWAMLRNLHYPKKAPTGTHAKHYLSFIATLNLWVGGNAVQGCTLPVHPSLSTTSPL